MITIDKREIKAIMDTEKRTYESAILYLLRLKNKKTIADLEDIGIGRGTILKLEKQYDFSRILNKSSRSMLEKIMNLYCIEEKDLVCYEQGYFYKFVYSFDKNVKVIAKLYYESYGKKDALRLAAFKVAMAKNNLVYKILGEKLGVSKQYINAISTGKEKASEEIKRKISEILGKEIFKYL